MTTQSDIAAALQRQGVTVYGLQVSGSEVRGTVGTEADRDRAQQAIRGVASDAQVSLQVNSGFADQAAKSGDTSGGRSYTVKAGDSLSKIAKEVYGDAAQWKKIHEANRASIPNPDMIHPGQELTLP
ncbi:MAG: LysM peptidoglycan-binding domain-containing protein [Gemmatirosa sp.]